MGGSCLVLLGLWLIRVGCFLKIFGVFSPRELCRGAALLGISSRQCLGEVGWSGDFVRPWLIIIPSDGGLIRGGAMGVELGGMVVHW